MKKYGNTAENEFAIAARKNGWSITKKGYPDFICYKGDELMLVEVKANGNGRLKTSQQKFMNTISKYGVKCYKWYPEKNWLRIKENT